MLAVDASLRQKHEQEKLALVAARIESYDVFDYSNVSDDVDKVGTWYNSVSLKGKRHERNAS